MSSPQRVPGRRNEKIGEVTSTRMAKTIVVRVTLRTAHALYGRGVTRHHSFYAPDAEGKAKLGDIVRIVETRPLSRLKRWRLVEIVRAAAQLPTREQIAQAVGEGELQRDTRRPAAPAPAAAEEAQS